MMATELPNATWHPAFMPDHESPEPPAPSQPPAEASLNASPGPFQNTTQVEPEPVPRSLDFGADEDDDANDWLAKDDVDDGGAWLASAPVDQPVDTDDTSLPAHVEAPSVPSGETPSISESGAKHSSSMSFARTVSHEVSFGDDDEGDWSLPRTNTDHFKSLPPSDRTDSFPIVPPIASNTNTETLAQPLRSTQALDVFEEDQRNWGLHDQPDEEETSQDPAPRSGPSRGHHKQAMSMGGDVQAFEGESSDARYEEGVPLIPSAEPQSQESTGANHGTSEGFFSQDDTEDDTFFAQINGSTENAAEDTFDPRPLERKSTSQVLGDFTADPVSRQSTMDTLAEADSTVEPHSSTTLAQKSAGGHKRTKTMDLDAKWKEAFGGDDDDGFLLDDSNNDAAGDKDVDPAAFLGSDDEGLLDDTEDSVPDQVQQDAMAPGPSTQSTPSQPSFSQASITNPYAPQNAYQPTAPIQQPQTQPVTATSQGFYNPPVPPAGSASVPPPARPTLAGTDQPRAQSFADKSKGGYSSPYDLPSDIMGSVPRPRKRLSMQQLHSPASTPQSVPPPPVSNGASSVPSLGPPPSNSRPPSSQASDGPPDVTQKPSHPPLRSKGSFFEELPIAPKPRPVSRPSSRGPSPAQYQPQGPPQASTPLGPPMGSPPVGGPPMRTPPHPAMAPPTAQVEPTVQPHGIGNLVAPERVSPYAALQSGVTPLPPPSRSASNYSPIPDQAAGNTTAPPTSGNRYSAAPPVPRQSSYSPSRAATTTPPVLPHQPRTSSPLAHFETHASKPHVELAPPERRSSSSSFEPRLNRIPSLPPTREVDEEEDQDDRSGSGAPLGTRVSSSDSKYSPAPPAAQQTPPPTAAQLATGPLMSPSKRSSSNYVPQAPHTTVGGNFAPPPRPQTQSPTATRAPMPDIPSHVRRPSSAHSPTTNEAPKSSQPSYAHHSRMRGPSLTMNMVEPTDGREQDPLKRWKGVPVFAWGVGGTVVTTFPKSIPRYTVSSATPTMSRTPGEVKVQSIKDIELLPERLAKFPGPLKGKSKKKETLAWLSSGIDALQKETPDVPFHSELSHEAKRSIERLLLWRILRVFIENDGVLEGNPTVEKSVAEILSPEATESLHAASFSGNAGLTSSAGAAISTQSDSVDPEAMESIRISLINGDRESAVWTAADKRLWGHAMLIAHTVSPSLYQQVAQEFVRKEVNYTGHSNEPMAALYKILSGNYDDCVDELVPSHARAGFQLVSTDASTKPSKGAVDGLDKWRQTLALVLRNRSPEDERGLSALGNLLAGYGRAEAAHICFMFSRNVSVFGGLDDPNASFVLLGSDHKQQASQLGKETEALQLSEVYEYGLTLTGAIAAAGGAPHLAGYKFQHAITLAEFGYRDKALQYCDSIAAAMSSQTRRSPYYNGYLASSIDNFMTRLKQAPRSDSGSWISKPSMNKVSDSMWNKFNKFVSGDDEDGSGATGAGNADHSPFSHVTPTISRSPSVNNFEMYGGAAASFSSAPPSRYSPAGAAPASSQGNPYEPTSKYAPGGSTGDHYNPNDYQGYPGTSAIPAPSESGSLSVPRVPSSNYQPLASPASTTAGYQPQNLNVGQSASTPDLSSTQAPSNQGYTPVSFGYEPPNAVAEPAVAESTNEEEATGSGSGGFEPPSLQPYGYEPPSYEPSSYEPPSYEPDADPSSEDGDVQKPTKSFMEDDDDDIPGLKPREKTKAEKDRENDEMFRKAVEEDEKRAEAEKAAKKGWGLGGWFSKKPATPKPNEPAGNKPVRANLGEASSFVYDPELKRWVNKKPGAENPEPKKPTPPPPRAMPSSAAGTPPPPMATPPPPGRSVSAGAPPRSITPSSTAPQLRPVPSHDSIGLSQQGSLSRSQSNSNLAGPPSAPPSRPGTGMSNASSIDDLIGAAAPRRPGQKKPRKSGRYVDVMATK